MNCRYCNKQLAFIRDRGFPDGSGKVYSCSDPHCKGSTFYFYDEMAPLDLDKLFGTLYKLQAARRNPETIEIITDRETAWRFKQAYARACYYRRRHLVRKRAWRKKQLAALARLRILDYVSL